MKLILCMGIALTALAIGGCGSTEASKEELARAYERGEKTGLTKARAEATERVSIAHKRGYSEGWDEAWSESASWNKALDTVEEEELEAIESEDPQRINPYPMKENGEPSYEFEPEDIERAEEAPTEVQEYCEGAVSEAQEVGCLSHVEAGEVP